MKKNQRAYILLIFLIPGNILLSQDKGLVKVSQETQVLRNGTKSIFRCDIYYNKEKDVIVTHHSYPSDFVKMSNRFGEMKIYFPSTNTVTIEESPSLSTTNELLYYFVNNRTSDLGLSKEGFKLVSSSREKDLLITIWQAPLSFKVVNQIKIVIRDLLPIYAEYIGMDGLIKKKIYYSKYSDFKTFRMPLRITEISFESKTDSTIRLSVFSNILTSDFPPDSYFNFKIPEDAKVAK
jgi:hypothetical protein